VFLSYFDRVFTLCAVTIYSSRNTVHSFFSEQGIEKENKDSIMNDNYKNEKNED